jgi:uncharacterized protein YggL (DUF469 family)
MSKNRSSRLRKKLHISEFQELGFEISFTLPENLDEERLDIFFDQFIEEAIENNSLQFGGGWGKDIVGFVTADQRRSVTEEHRTLVRSWLAAKAIVSDIRIGELVDAWASHEEME